MTDIKCQARHKPNASGTFGCRTCGGYGIVLTVTRCTKCGKEYLSRPGPHTIYEGKEFVSVDGLHLIYRSMKDGAECFEH